MSLIEPSNPTAVTLRIAPLLKHKTRTKNGYYKYVQGLKEAINKSINEFCENTKSGMKTAQDMWTQNHERKVKWREIWKWKIGT